MITCTKSGSKFVIEGVRGYASIMVSKEGSLWRATGMRDGPAELLKASAKEEKIAVTKERAIQWLLGTSLPVELVACITSDIDDAMKKCLDE